MSRRAPGEGAILKDPSRLYSTGSTRSSKKVPGYRGSLTVTDAWGAKHTYCPRGRTRAEVAEKLAAFKVKHQGQHVATDMTFEAWIGVWLVDQRASIRRRSSTVDGYADIARLYLTPTLGAYRLNEITPAVVESWMAGLVGQKGQPLSAHSRRQAFVVLRASLKEATARHLMESSPAERVDPPDISRVKRRPAYTVEEQTLLISEARRPRPARGGVPDVGRPWRNMEVRVALALGLGLRQGEILGLKLSHWDGTRLTVQASRSRTEYSHGELCRSMSMHSSAACPVRVRVHPDGDTKRPASDRELRPTREVAAILDRQARAVREEKLALGSAYQDDPYLLGTRVGGPVTRSNDSKSWVALCRVAGVRELGTHSTRRSFVTALAGANIPDSTIATIAGWTPENASRMVATYARPSDEVQREAMQAAIGGLFSTSAM